MANQLNNEEKPNGALILFWFVLYVFIFFVIQIILIGNNVDLSYFDNPVLFLGVSENAKTKIILVVSFISFKNLLLFTIYRARIENSEAFRRFIMNTIFGEGWIFLIIYIFLFFQTESLLKKLTYFSFGIIFSLYLRFLAKKRHSAKLRDLFRLALMSSLASLITVFVTFPTFS